ncbi:hypothetical protein [Xylophilus sp.]|uniref:hypothetical protein n=1 Tax=Xylophilus sp. TaxID=2653893 RepID=UPI0013B7B641|nr:hypothetical protein [Xylophilus sp.]KAF1043356.1 MAG: hypothetical protein GAK38_04006 [Xylophilus sp.]
MTTTTLLRPLLCTTAFAAALLAAGCATHPSAAGGEWGGYHRWQQAALAEAQQGTLAWSSYYQQSFDRLTVLPPSLEQDARLEATVNLLSLARKRDAGEIAPDAFEQQRAVLEARLAQRLQHQ